MKKVLHNILSVFLAIVVLFSTMSFTVNMHYCGRTLVDISIFKEAKTCEMEMPNQSNAFTKKKGCCTDKQVNFEGQDDLKITWDTFAAEQQLFIASFYFSYINIFEELQEHNVPFKEYPPPLLVKNIYMVHETYLI